MVLPPFDAGTLNDKSIAPGRAFKRRFWGGEGIVRGVAVVIRGEVEYPPILDASRVILYAVPFTRPVIVSYGLLSVRNPVLVIGAVI